MFGQINKVAYIFVFDESNSLFAIQVDFFEESS